MDPGDVRGILKPERTFPPPRKSSLSVAAGKTIIKKYRKVRIARCIKYKVITPVDGWRPDRTRMPDDVPDEEEQQRLAELATREQKEAEEQRRRRKRKSIGMSIFPSMSGETSIDGGEEEASNPIDIHQPKSPDVFYDGFIKAGNADSDEVLFSEDGEKTEEGRKPFGLALFPFKGQDKPAEPSIDSNYRQGRRRSLRIQEREEMRRTMFVNSEKTKKEEPMEEEKTKAEEKRERRKSKMFPVTPLRESSLDRETNPVENANRSARRKSGMFPLTPLMESSFSRETKPMDTSLRRRSGVIRPLSAKKEEETSSSTNPYNDDPCRSEEQMKADDASNMERKTKKVSAWLTRSDTTTAMAEGEETGEGNGSVEIEVTRDASSRETLFSERSSDIIPLVEAAKSVQLSRKGRRSMKLPREIGREENEYSPNSSVLLDKKRARRLTIFVPWKSLAVQNECTPVEENEEKKDDTSYSGDRETRGDCEEVMMKMRRLSVQLPPRRSSYGIPMRSKESDPVEIVSVSDEEREEVSSDERTLHYPAKIMLKDVRNGELSKASNIARPKKNS